MKKFIYAALAVAAVLLFASCKNDKNQPKGEEKADAYVSFTFNLPQGGTRAGLDGKNAGDEYQGTNDEQEIKEVRVVLYDKTSGDVKYAFDYSITATGGAAATGPDLSGAATASKFKTKAKGVVSQEYAMLAFINPTAAIKTATAEGKFLADAMAAIKGTPNDFKANGIMMSNARGVVSIEKTQLKDAEATAEASPIAVSVDRILAKVFVGSTGNDGKPNLPTGVKFTKIKWQLNTTNNKTYAFRMFGKVMKELNNFVEEDPTSTESYYTRFNSYAKDPNFADYEFNVNDFTYLEGAQDLTNDFGYEDAKGEYCLENTMDQMQQKHNRTTSFVLSGVWTPANKTEMTFTEGESWYSYMGFTFTTEKMKEYIKEAKDTSKDKKPEIDNTPTGFKAALKELLKTTGTKDYTVDETTGEPSAAGTAQNIKAYKKGVCYYQTNLIRHFNDSQSNKDMGYGRYGVVRNNIYKINITKIDRPGEPKINNEKDDDGDDDPSKVYVSFEVTVNPWIVRTQDIAL